MTSVLSGNQPLGRSSGELGTGKISGGGNSGAGSSGFGLCGNGSLGTGLGSGLGRSQISVLNKLAFATT